MKKWIILAFYLFVIAIVFINRAFLMNWIKESDSSYLPFMFLLAIFFATIPVIPFSLFAGIMGAKYGVIISLLINLTGGITGAVIYYLLAKYLFSNFFTKFLKRYKSIDKFNEMIEKNAFFAILFSRMTPIIPPPVINIYSGLMKVSFRTYFSASIIGLIPPMLMYSYGGEQVFSSLQNFLIGIGAYVVFLLIIFLIYRTWFREKVKV